ncbi:hypothetical protein NKR23_g1284 [Pleurostoma richardsiae]|uniref:Developmental regulatory protein wetA n=1 Tax=Pleurostoma richardsiae TaxID=41990 RepID=A0AA38VX49_9PEZI|nr:hypothetical protein NKR23_g1284 [Pleurostoma richardsiae]
MASTPGSENPFGDCDFSMDKGDFSWLDPGGSGGANELFDQFIVLEGGGGGRPSDSMLGGDGDNHDHLYQGLLLPQEEQDDDGSTSLISPPASVGAAAGHCPSTVSADPSLAAANGSQCSRPPSTAVAQMAPQVHPQGGGSAARVGPGPADTETSEQRTAHITNRTNRTGGAASISDCDLRQLEGLNMRSPKVISGPAPAAPGPPVVAPPSPPPQQRPPVSPKKTSRLENIYSTIRKAAKLPTRLRQQPQTVPIPQDVTPQTGTPAHVESAKRATHRLTSESFAMPSRGSPYIKQSPTHRTGPFDVPEHRPQQQHDDSMDFVSGYIDDPFMEPNSGMLAPGPRLSVASVPNTPLHTPQFNGNAKQGHVDIDINGVTFVTSAPGSTVTTWPMDHTPIVTDGSFGDWSSAVCMPDGLPGWWAQAGGGDVDIANIGHFQTNGKNPPMNLPLQMPPPYEYSHGNGSVHDLTATGGLMIHMPQPRTPGSAPVLSHHDMAMNGQYFPPPHPDQQQQQQLHAQQQPQPQAQPQHQPPPRSGYHSRHHSEHRRPKPRAPSSGARHHGAMTSPRKTRQPSLSSSSPSPTPRSARRSTSMNSLSGGVSQQHPAAVRKRRSFTGGGGGGGGVGGGASHHPRTPSGSSTGSIGFVNYTPSDSAVLMTGVAPSGSSKTKARREKEAAERQRKLNEAFMKAVSAAGGDVGKLQEEIMI